MDTQALSNIAHAILAAVVEKELVDTINTEIENGGSVEEAVAAALKKVKLSFKPTQASTPNSSNRATVGTSTGATKTSKTVKKDVLTDEHGVPRKCCAIKKSDNTQCGFDAKEEHNGKFYCKVHIKTATNTKPSKEKKPAFDKGNQKTSSSVEDVLSEIDSGVDLDL